MNSFLDLVSWSTEVHKHPSRPPDVHSILPNRWLALWRSISWPWLVAAQCAATKETARVPCTAHITAKGGSRAGRTDAQLPVNAAFALKITLPSNAQTFPALSPRSTSPDIW
eukprot:29350-Pelagococcus_subviridis.AAC.11